MAKSKPKGSKPGPKKPKPATVATGTTDTTQAWERGESVATTKGE